MRWIVALLLVVGAGSTAWLAVDRDDRPDRGTVAATDDLLAITSGTAPPDCQLPDGDATLADANLGFAWRSFHAIDASARDEGEETTTYSPYSAATALHMLANGADPGTDEQLLASMCLRGTSLGALSEQDHDLIGLLRRGDEVTISNGIWTMPPYRPAARLDTIVRDRYDGVLEPFEDTDQVDDWVEDRTEGRIEGILDGVDLSDVYMLLVNAITFDGTWKTTFEEPRPGPFRAGGDSEETFDVPMLRDQRELDYAFSEDDDDLRWADEATLAKRAPAAFHAARIPYEGDRFAMVVVVPALDDGLDDVVDALGPDAWRRLRARFEPTSVSLAMPTLDLKADRFIHEELFAGGLPEQTYNSIFDPKPAEPAFIAFIKQSTFLQVDEDGTRAAAATVVGVGVSAGAPVGVPVEADHPYLVAIEDLESGELLLLSAIRDPRR